MVNESKCFQGKVHKFVVEWPPAGTWGYPIFFCEKCGVQKYTNDKTPYGRTNETTMTVTNPAGDPEALARRVNEVMRQRSAFLAGDGEVS